MRILVCGSRHFDNWLLLHRTLYEIVSPYFINMDDLVIIEGGAKGADFLARCWAKVFDVKFEEYPADWNTYGKGAGPIRNRQMLVKGKPDLVVAFLAKDSRGTKNMIEQAEEEGVPVKVINI